MTTIRELKKDAKVRLSGNYFKLVFMYLFYGIIIFAFSYIARFINSSIAKFIYAIILLVFSVPFSFGLISCIMDVIRGKNTTLTQFINVGLENIGCTWNVYLRIILKLLLPIIFFIASMFFMFITLVATIFGVALRAQLSNYLVLSIVLFLISAILLLILSLYYAFAFYLLKDKPEKSAKKIISLSRELMKGNIIKYIGLGLSFIGWYLLIFAISFISAYFLPQNAVSLVTEIGTLLLFPYITTTMIGFYEDVLYDKTHTNEKK